MRFDRKTLKTARENSGKTAGTGAQTAGIWKTLEKSVFGTNCPKIAKFRYFSVFLPISGGIQGLKPDFVVLPPDQADIGFVWIFYPFWGLCFGSDTFWVCFKGLSTHCQTRSLNEKIWRILESKTIPSVYFCRCRFSDPNPCSRHPNGYFTKLIVFFSNAKTNQNKFWHQNLQKRVCCKTAFRMRRLRFFCFSIECGFSGRSFGVDPKTLFV